MLHEVISMIAANEKMAGKDTNFDEQRERKLFVCNIGQLLKQTNAGIIGCELTDDGIVFVFFHDKHTQKINVTGDSYGTIARDIMCYLFQ